MKDQQEALLVLNQLLNAIANGNHGSLKGAAQLIYEKIAQQAVQEYIAKSSSRSITPSIEPLSNISTTSSSSHSSTPESTPRSMSNSGAEASFSPPPPPPLPPADLLKPKQTLSLQEQIAKNKAEKGKVENTSQNQSSTQRTSPPKASQQGQLDLLSLQQKAQERSNRVGNTGLNIPNKPGERKNEIDSELAAKLKKRQDVSKPTQSVSHANQVAQSRNNPGQRNL